MTKYRPISFLDIFYVDDETDLVMYCKAEDEYQASMEWEGVALVDVRSAVMGYVRCVEAYVKYADVFESAQHLIEAIQKEKDFWFPGFFEGDEE